jgi:ABC-2 type transport system permease protein
MAVITLWLNGALAAQGVALLVVLIAAGLMLVEIGLIYGTASKNVTGVFTLIKGTGFILLAPTVFYIFPDWPQWIAKVFPTYWVINPVYEVTINGAGLGAVSSDLVVAGGVIAAMVVPIVLLSRALETKIGLAS